MTDEERNDLLELKAFLEKALISVEDDLILTDPRLSKNDYDFLIKKARMYRNNLDKVIELLNESN
ncbi:hypothetical protein GO730_12650 [Spirosoma sp. HMF3257]|uniref:Uncharacterized protein n=1 Tax=Spirosoma telluris TaxID=2183553 RepID=A0A327NHH9_9BACT|nr:hypothetical protein [Spirosoma telluris]RAI74860.1 hypothetical protein HMF3257_12560 [Spirosoma telluris]